MGFVVLSATSMTSNLVLAQSKAPIKNITEQNITEQNITVAYNTSFFYELEEGRGWELKNAEGQLLKSGVGLIENEIFNKPGTYTLHVSPSFNQDIGAPNAMPELITIQVSPLKMVFDFSAVKFSENIVGGQSIQGISVSVKVMYSSFDSSSSVYKSDFVTAGVGTSIVGKLKKKQVRLQEGLNTLEFVLEGQATKGNYIALDFVDINGEVQSYSLMDKIK